MKDYRRETSIPAEFRAGAIRGRGNVRNVSEGGLFVGTRAIPKAGTNAKVRLVAPGKVPVEVFGLVWWTASPANPLDRSCGFGLRVLDDDDGYRRLVESIRR
jgi:hypothetical protein